MKKDISADIYRIGLLLGYYSPEIVITWAEIEIVNGNNAPYIIELLLAHNQSPADIITILKEATKESVHSEIVNNFFLGFYYDSIKKGTFHWMQIAIEIIRYFGLGEFSISDSEKIFISTLNNDLSLRKENLGGILTMPEDLIDFLRKFDSYSIIMKAYNLMPPKIR